MTRGVLLAMTAGVCWGTMGVAAQYLIHYCRFRPIDLVSLRLVIAGFLLLVFFRVSGGTGLMSPFNNRRNFIGVFIVGLLLFSSQLTFMESVRAADAGTATILITTIPLLCGAYFSVVERKLPSLQMCLCFVLAFAGVVFIVTHGQFDSVNVSFAGVLWGMTSAALSAAYSIQPRLLLARLGVGPVVGWGMIFGGITACVLNPPWTIDVDWTSVSIASFAWIILVGTIVAFWCYLTAVKMISPVIVGLLVCLEPLTAYILSVFLYGQVINRFDVFGIALVLSNVFLLAVPQKKIDSLLVKLKLKKESAKA